jgi:hypothetical protein
MTHLIVLTVINDRPNLITVNGAIDRSADINGFREIYADPDGGLLASIPRAGILRHRITDEDDAPAEAARLRAEFQIRETLATPASHDTH